jgi:RNA polymerase sigma factor (sigma-70 family)
MSAFPETSATLLSKLAAQITGEDEANWARFVDLYVPAIRDFARHRGDGRDVDDVVQEVLAGLVRVLRSGSFSVREGKGNFRAYLAKMIRSQLYMAYRREKARGLGLNVPLDDVQPSVSSESVTAAIDAEWAAARHRAAVEHVLTKTLVSDLNKRLYRAYVLDDRPIDEVAREFGVTRNQVSQAKVRIGRMVAAIEDV